MSKEKEDTEKEMDEAIKLMKNKVQRNIFNRKVNQWVSKKFNKIYHKSSITTDNKDLQKQQQLKKKIVRQLQKQFKLKFSIQNLMKRLPMQYCQKLINYLVQKKLYWIFIIEEQQQSQVWSLQKKRQIMLAYELKNFYKKIQYHGTTINVNIRDSLTNQMGVDNQKDVNNQQIYTPSDKKSLKMNEFSKLRKDFQFQLLLIFSVSLIASFFQQFFPQLSVDDNFKSQVFVVITHVFLDLQVSPSVFSIMKRKFYVMQNVRNFKSLNANYIYELSLSRRNKGRSKNDHNQIFNADTPLQEDKAPEVQNIGIKQRITSQTKITSSKIKSLTNSISNLNLGKNKIKRQMMLKPVSSIENNLITQRLYQEGKLHILGNTSHNSSRFEQLNKCTKQKSIYSIVEDPMGYEDLPSQDQLSFYSTIKTTLHVDSLPVIAKKKININDYQRLNEVGELKQIKKQVKSIDVMARKKHIKTNELSLAMNAFISTSCGFALNRKNKNKNNLQLFSTTLEQNTYKSNKQDRDEVNNKRNLEQIDNGQEYTFQLRKLPFKSAFVKLKPQNSSSLYKFNGTVSLQLSKNPSFRQIQQIGLTLGSSLYCQNRKLFRKDKPTNTFVDHQMDKKRGSDYLHKKRKSMAQWNQFIQTLKSNHRKQEVATLGESQKGTEKKRHLQRQPYCKYRQRESILPTITQRQINRIPIEPEQNVGIDYKNCQVNVQKQTLMYPSEKYLQRQSIFIQLSNKLQQYQLGTKEISQMQQTNQKNNISEEQQQTKYTSLYGQVNAHKDIPMNYKSLYESFQLKKNLKMFEQNCKNRQQKINYSIFSIKNYKHPFKQTYHKENKKGQQIET